MVGMFPAMDSIDQKICEILQRDGRASSASLAEAVGLSVSSANERVRRLESSGVIQEWRAALDPNRVGAGLCAFLLIDMAYEGEAAAAEALAVRPEIMELHHISGAHSYLAKVRVADMAAMQRLLTDVVKPLAAVTRTETFFALESVKETSAMLVAPGTAR